jgi:hypothetical protein
MPGADSRIIYRSTATFTTRRCRAPNLRYLTRIFQVRYQKIDGNGLEQFERPGTQVILFPQAYKSGKLEYPLPQP